MELTNEMIADKIMGYRVYNRHDDPEYFYAANLTACRIDDFVVDVPDFLTDMNAAMMVVEKMWEKGWRPTMILFSDGWYVKFLGVNMQTTNMGIYKAEQFKSLPTAIGTAALKAMEAS